ncbi:unnamed protein product [Linum trigynum]|uniref:Uncharacterized protein n=1 Tax=Linum trigynum TaxID=586398 RepID=A0AAV2DKT8_9ROSI
MKEEGSDSSTLMPEETCHLAGGETAVNRDQGGKFQDNGGAAGNVDFQRQQSQRGLPTTLWDCQPADCLAWRRR